MFRRHDFRTRSIQNADLRIERHISEGIQHDSYWTAWALPLLPTGADSSWILDFSVPYMRCEARTVEAPDSNVASSAVGILWSASASFLFRVAEREIQAIHKSPTGDER